MPETAGRTVVAVLYPAVAEAAARVGTTSVGLIDVGRPTGRELALDRVGISYDNGQSLGDPSAPDPCTASVVGARPIPTRPLPEVVARIAVDRDPVGALPDAVAGVPDGALPVVLTTWALSRLTPEKRVHFVDRLREAGRTLAWVSVEGVGVAPSIPTLGDRPASGHSIVGVAVVDGSVLHAEAVGRCWSRGRWLAWLVDS